MTLLWIVGGVCVVGWSALIVTLSLEHWRHPPWNMGTPVLARNLHPGNVVRSPNLTGTWRVEKVQYNALGTVRVHITQGPERVAYDHRWNDAVEVLG